MKPNPETIIGMAKIAGVPIDADAAQRVLRFVGPAIENFAPIAAALPFDCEPATFVVAQQAKRDA